MAATIEIYGFLRRILLYQARYGTADQVGELLVACDAAMQDDPANTSECQPISAACNQRIVDIERHLGQRKADNTKDDGR